MSENEERFLTKFNVLYTTNAISNQFEEPFSNFHEKMSLQNFDVKKVQEGEIIPTPQLLICCWWKVSLSSKLGSGVILTF